METKLFSKSHIIKWALTLGIIIVLNLFFIVSIQLVYNEPEWEDFCGDEQVRIIPQTQDECIEVGGQWVDGTFVSKGVPRAIRVEPPIPQKDVEAYCNPDYTCRQEFSDAHDLYERNVFIALIILGTLTLIGSYFFRAYEIIATAFSFGGVLTLVIASMRYWSNMDEYLRVIVLAVALVALIWAGIKKFKD